MAAGRHRWRMRGLARPGAFVQRWTENHITGYSQRASIEPQGLPPDVLPAVCSRDVRFVPAPRGALDGEARPPSLSEGGRGG
jgi:hypothetical protein